MLFSIKRSQAPGVKRRLHHLEGASAHGASRLYTVRSLRLHEHRCTLRIARLQLAWCAAARHSALSAMAVPLASPVDTCKIVIRARPMIQAACYTIAERHHVCAKAAARQHNLSFF